MSNTRANREHVEAITKAAQYDTLADACSDGARVMDYRRLAQQERDRAYTLTKTVTPDNVTEYDALIAKAVQYDEQAFACADPEMARAYRELASELRTKAQESAR